MQRDRTSVTELANNTEISCEKLLYCVYAIDNNNTIIGTLFSLSEEIVEKLSSTEEDTASDPPISTMTARASSWQTGV
jgi:hypothetical protein